ncbi:hypothetical protein SAMN05444172_6802 [Burkholderia sp. GAS332]|nr:hypothetical protein SAMN05444172_6802 [Burkholderia sp. GAS332]
MDFQQLWRQAVLSTNVVPRWYRVCDLFTVGL